MRFPFSRPSLRPYLRHKQEPATNPPLAARFLGTSSVLFQDGETAILSDGFVSRPGLRYGGFTLTFVDSVHSPGDRWPGTIDEPLVPPAKTREWKSDLSYSVLIEHRAGTVLMHASANYRLGSLRGKRADVVYLGVGTLGKQSAGFVESYWDEVVRATGARRVILVHWDDFFRPLDRPLRPSPYGFDDLDECLRRLLPLADEDDVDVVLPVAWQVTDPFAGLP